MADVFLSYKREDAARVRKLVEALREAELDVWWDEDIPPSAPWEATIEWALAEAKAVIVCWSPASVASENVRSEARVAREDGRLIQVFVKPSTPPLFFGERQGVDLSRWRGNADDVRISTLAETVRKVVAGERAGETGLFVSRPRPSKARGLNRVAVIAVIFLVILGAATLIAYRAAIARPAPEIAIIPFEDLSPAHDKAYFAEGIGEEILSALSTDRQIKVLGRTSARQIKRDADPKAVRKSLGVTHLLEGSARTSGDALRVNVRLIDTRDGSTVWENEYQGRLSDVFAVQDRVASAVVRNLHGIFAGGGAPVERPVTKVNVYESYLAARAIMRTRSEPTLRQALGLAKQVVANDPNYAPGQALYAELVWLLSDDPDTYGTIPSAIAGRLAESHARAAIKLAPNQADGYAAFGLIQTIDEQAAIRALRRAIVLDPSRADERIWLAIRLTKNAHYDEALQFSRDAAAIEPLWPVPINDLVVRLAVNGQVAEAHQVAEQYRSRGGNVAQYQRLVCAIESRGPDISSAIASGEKGLALDSTLPDIRVNLSQLYYLVGLEQRAASRTPTAFAHLARPFYSGDTDALEAQIRSSGTRLWDLPDSGIGFFHLAVVHDWTTLNRLYDERPIPPEQLCFHYTEAAQALVPALRAAGRQADAQALLSCLRNRLVIEAGQKARSWYEYWGDYEFNQATLAALIGDNGAALNWLNQAVTRGWLGRPYSPNLTDRPQFDALRSNRRLAVLQATIDRRIAHERAKVLSSHPSSS
jgi:TolB-like protein